MCVLMQMFCNNCRYIWVRTYGLAFSFVDNDSCPKCKSPIPKKEKDTIKEKPTKDEQK